MSTKRSSGVLFVPVHAGYYGRFVALRLSDPYVAELRRQSELVRSLAQDPAAREVMFADPKALVVPSVPEAWLAESDRRIGRYDDADPVYVLGRSLRALPEELRERFAESEVHHHLGVSVPDVRWSVYDPDEDRWFFSDTLTIEWLGGLRGP